MTDLNRLPLPSLYEALAAAGGVERLLRLAAREDLGEPAQDITSESLISPDASARAAAAARERGVIAGLAAAPTLLSIMAPDARIHPLVSDGDEVEAGAVIATLDGPARQLLALERTLLNLLERLSGVATNTARFVRAAADAAPDKPPAVMDTRKTTPGLRALEKYAVRCGGGTCHRIGLFDAMLIKDNHLRGTPASRLPDRVATAAVEARSRGGVRFVEVEVDRLDQFEALLALDPGVVDIILLDNTAPTDLRRAVEMRDKRRPGLLLEASGGVRLETVPDIARTGVDRISAGALTHDARWLDVGLDFE